MSGPAIIMVAPNGARKTHRDHPALPVSIEETVNEAADCFAAGATVLHAHVRDQNEVHALDAGLYIELIGELKRHVPDMLVQITTEAVGIFSPEQQVECVQKVLPQMCSVALKEMTSNFERLEFARNFYYWALEAGVHVQHILYSVEDLKQYLQLKAGGFIPTEHRCVLFVLGRYAVDFQSSTTDVQPFLAEDLTKLNWFTCAFGKEEQNCLLASIDAGGHARVGFENNLHLADGSLAASTSALVQALVSKLGKQGRSVANSSESRQILGINQA